MTSTDARPPVGLASPRMARDERREALLDAAATLVATGGSFAVSMEAVAEMSGVSRPLVYKHFSNREDLLSAVYQRESDRLHHDLSALVSQAQSIEAKFRALIRGALQAEADRGSSLAALHAAGARTQQMRQQRKVRDRGTLKHFVRQATQEYEVDERAAQACLTVVLRAIDGVVGEWRQRPTPHYASVLEDAYVTVAMGALERLAAGRGD